MKPLNTIKSHYLPLITTIYTTDVLKMPELCRRIGKKSTKNNQIQPILALFTKKVLKMAELCNRGVKMEL